MRATFKGSILRSVISKHGYFVHVPTGRDQDRPPPAVPACHWDGPEVLTTPSTPVNSEAVCPVVADQHGGADLCVACGLASAVHISAMVHRRVRCCCRTSGDAIFRMWRTARRSASVVPGKCVRKWLRRQTDWQVCGPVCVERLCMPRLDCASTVRVCGE